MFPNTVKYTIKIDSLRNEGATRHKTPRKKSYTERDERNIIRHVRLFPKDTYKEVIFKLDLQCKRSTVKKILKKHGILNLKAKRRALLTEEHALKRLAWCLSHKNMRKEEWGMIVWSDECSLKRGRGKRDEWVFCIPAQKWDVDKVQTYGTNRNMKVMVWGSFWNNGRSNLYIIDRDFRVGKA